MTVKTYLLPAKFHWVAHTDCRPYTVEPPINGQVGASTLVHFSKVILYWGVGKKPYICIACHIDLFYFTQGFKTYDYVIRDKTTQLPYST